MVTNESLIKKINEQVQEAEKVVNDPVLFKEAIKRVELLCELVTDDNVARKHTTQKVTPEMLNSSKDNSKKQISPEPTSDSIFDF